MANPYLVQLTRSKKSNSFYGEDDLFYAGTPEEDKAKFTYGIKKAVMTLGGIVLGFGALIAAPSIYTKITGRTPEQALGLRGGKNWGSFNEHLPLADRIESLLGRSKQSYKKGKSVDDIVGSFAIAQELIHTEEFKHDLPHNVKKQEIVEQFANLGMELSR